MMDIIRKADSRHERIVYEVVGLAWLAKASDPGAVAVPVLDLGVTWFEEPRLVSAPPTVEAVEQFGCALARTHAVGAPHLGAPPPGFEGDGWMGEAHLASPRHAHNNDNGDRHHAGTDVSSDTSHPGRPARDETVHDRAPASYRSWGAFYVRERIAPYLYAPAFSASNRILTERLCERLESGALDHGQLRLIVDAIARTGGVGAARIHGDLWNGDVMWTLEGAALIDPVAQGGHAEEDLAVLAVFGCPHYGRILAAYNEAPPPEDGWRERVALYQVYIITIRHVLFGRSYAPEAVSIVRRYGQKGTPSRWVGVHGVLRMTMIRPIADPVYVDVRRKQPT